MKKAWYTNSRKFPVAWRCKGGVNVVAMVLRETGACDMGSLLLWSLDNLLLNAVVLVDLNDMNLLREPHNIVLQ